MKVLSDNSFADRYPAQLIVPLFDALSIVVGGLFGYWLRFGSFHLHERFWLAVIIMALLVVLLNTMQRGYSSWRIKRIPSMIARLWLTWFIVAVTAASIIYFAHAADRYSRLWVGYTLLSSFMLAAGGRVLAQLLLRRARRQGRARRPVFLVGPGENLIRVARGMRQYPAEGYSIAGMERISMEPDDGVIERLSRRVVESNASEVWICVPLEMGAVVRSIFYVLRNHTAEVRFLPDFRDMQLLNHSMSEVAGHLSVDLSVTPFNGVTRIVKRLEDLILGGIISVLILPVCLFIAVAIKLSSPGPVLFKQHRMGNNGKQFKVYKFRSMAVHKEPQGIITQACRDDPRVTRLGAFLRRTSLDELPQFYNVLQGRMSIVGPRPHALAHNEYYKEIVESYMKRHKVKPGITGWAQVNGLRGETDTIEKMERRVEHDLWYIDNWSLWLDLRVIGMTIFRGFVNKNAY